MRILAPAALLTALSACGGMEFDRSDLSSMFGPATDYRNPVAQRRVGNTFHANDSLSRSGNAAHWTLPDGCTYSRTQAPGRTLVWYLVLNPHHVGMPKAHRGCAVTVVEGE